MCIYKYGHNERTMWSVRVDGGEHETVNSGLVGHVHRLIIIVEHGGMREKMEMGECVPCAFYIFVVFVQMFQFREGENDTVFPHIFLLRCYFYAVRKEE